MKFVVTNIEWDTDDLDLDDELDGDLARVVECNLPDEVNLTIPKHIVDRAESVSDAIADALSETYGFCVKGFSVSKEERTDESLCV